MTWPEKNIPTTDGSEKRSLGVGVFRLCEGCGATLTTSELSASFEVCSRCGHHHKLDAEGWKRLLIDDATFEPWDEGLAPEDPLEFNDGRAYRERIASSQTKTGARESMEIGRARLDGRAVAIGAFVFAFMGGSMGSVAGEKIARLFERAGAESLPVVMLQASGGARMQEGILSLMQMAKTVAAVERFRRLRLPFLSVLRHPTTGGVAASFAFLGDVNIAEPNALIGFAGQRVIESTIRQALPAGFQRAEFLVEHEMVDMIVPRGAMRGTLSRIFASLWAYRGEGGAGRRRRRTPRASLSRMPSSSLATRLESLCRRVPQGMVLGLDRVLAALAEVGNPHLAFPVAHIAGTNGKGSVSAMTEAMARHAGLRTGLFTSPHLCRFAERIQVNGVPLEDDEFARVLGVVDDRCGIPLTFFEMLTVAAFTAFADAQVDLAVVEVGLGGRLDATNVVRRPLVTAITSIAMDHMNWLGNSIQAIAGEKAGILKTGVPVVLGPLPGAADETIEAAACAVGAGPRFRVTRAQDDQRPGAIAVREEDGLAVIQHESSPGTWGSAAWTRLRQGPFAPTRPARAAPGGKCRRRRRNCLAACAKMAGRRERDRSRPKFGKVAGAV